MNRIKYKFELKNSKVNSFEEKVNNQKREKIKKK